MENQSSIMLSGRVNVEFAFNNTDFSDRVLHIEIMNDSLDSKSDSEGCFNRKRKREKSDEENDEASCTVGKVKTLHVSSPILVAKSAFFYKLFTNGMRESKQRDATLRINAHEEAGVMEVLKFMYTNTLKANTAHELLGVLIAADKLEASDCVRHCSKLLQNLPMSLESALLYLELPPRVLTYEEVQPIIDAARKWLL